MQHRFQNCGKQKVEIERMPIDELFLENIDEFVNDENKVVTYKNLSSTLNVHCNVAKQMLYAFLTQERDKKGKEAITATYFISGLTKPDNDGSQVFKCVVTSEEKLAEWKSRFAVVTSCHLYSIQKSKLKDANPLYMSDYEKFKENIFQSNKYSSIHYDKAKPRTEDDMDLLMVNIPATEPEKKASPSKKTEVSKMQTKKDQKSAIANMFAKVDNTKKAAAKPEKGVKKEEEKKGAKKTTASKDGKKGGMMGFLSKPSDSKSSATVETKKTPEKKASPVNIKKDPSPVNVKKDPSPASTKKSQRTEDSDDEDIFRSKKRRRTRTDIFESSDDEEQEMETEPEDPIIVKEQSPEPEIIDDDEEEPAPPKQPSPAKESNKDDNSTKSTKGGKKTRVRKRKQVSKTSVDKDGFMVTEKVWESDSTDASEVEEPVKKPVKKASPKKKPSPTKKGSGKQTSLMSFFKKS